jgi:hypothetical protein
MASYIDLNHFILTKSRATIGDYIWLRHNNHHSQAKVTWNFANQPLALGKIKLLDLVLQSLALLSKLLIQGLFPGFEP